MVVAVPLEACHRLNSLLFMRCLPYRSASLAGAQRLFTFLAASKYRLIERQLLWQWYQSQYVPRARIEHQQRLAGFAVAGVEELKPAMPVDRIPFPVEAALGGHNPVLAIVLVVRSGAEQHIEFSPVARRNRAGDRRSGEPGAATDISGEGDVGGPVAVGLRREGDVEFNRRLVDVDVSVLEKILQGLEAESL
jgi:hypothetical protein